MDAPLPNGDLGARLDALLESHDSLIMGAALEYQRANLAHVLAKYPVIVPLFELCFSLLAEITDGLNYADKSHWPPTRHRAIQFVLFVHNLKTLESTEDRLVKGCYGDAFVLLRVPYEAFLRMVFMSLFPTGAMAALSPIPGQRAFNATHLIEQDLRLPWGEHTLLSVFTHSHRYTALSHVIDIARRGNRDAVALEYHFDENLFSLGWNLLSVVCYMYLRMAASVFGDGIMSPPGLVERIRKASALADCIGAMVRTHHGEYLPAVIDDLDDIFETMRMTDAGWNWRFAWWRIRVVRTLRRIRTRRTD